MSRRRRSVDPGRAPVSLEGRRVQLLWREVGDGADHGAFAGQILVVARDGRDAQIHDLHAVGSSRICPETLAHEHVVELDVAVHHALRVQIGQRAGDVFEHLGLLTRAEPAATRELPQRGAPHEFHGDAEDAELEIFEQAHRTHQRWMVQLGQGTCFASRPLEVVGSPGDHGHELQRAGNVRCQRITGLPNRALAAFAQRFDQHIAIDLDTSLELHAISACP